MCIKIDLALNNQQRLICHKNQTNKNSYLGWVIVCLFKDPKFFLTCNFQKLFEVSISHVIQAHNIHLPFAKLQRRESLSLRQDFNFDSLLVKSHKCLRRKGLAFIELILSCRPNPDSHNSEVSRKTLCSILFSDGTTKLASRDKELSIQYANHVALKKLAQRPVRAGNERMRARSTFPYHHTRQILAKLPEVL